MSASISEFVTFEGAELAWRGGDEGFWISARSVCDVLGIKRHLNALDKLEDDERKLMSMETSGGRQDVAMVNESGLYHLIFMSRKPEAKRFRLWVTRELLPQIRRTGSYTPNEPGDPEQSDRPLRPLSQQEENVISELRRIGCFLVSRPMEGEITIERYWFGEQLQRFSLTDVHMLGHMVKLLGLSWSYYQQEQALHPEHRGPLGIGSAKVQHDDHIKMAVTQAEKIGAWLKIWGDDAEKVYEGTYA